MRNNKTKARTTTIIIAALMIGLALLSPMTVLPDVNAQQPNSISNTAGILKAQPQPMLSNDDKQTIMNAALNSPGIKGWSNNWQLENIGFIGIEKPAFSWKYAIVHLHLPSNSPAPVSCDIGWYAMAKVDLTTKQVVFSDYPSMRSHVCHGVELSTTTPGFAAGTQDDVLSSTNSYNGNYAELPAPSYASTIWSDMDPNTGSISQTVNAEWNYNCNATDGDGYCFTQAGWLITNEPGCSGCGISTSAENIVYVDESSTSGNPYAQNTGLTWTSGQTMHAGISCAGGTSTVNVLVSYNGFLAQEPTSIPCSAVQTNRNHDNSVFAENHNTESDAYWSGDITSSVTATNAAEYYYSGSQLYSQPWGNSQDLDEYCGGVPYNDNGNIMTGGTLANSNQVTWNLSKMVAAC